MGFVVEEFTPLSSSALIGSANLQISWPLIQNAAIFAPATA